MKISRENFKFRIKGRALPKLRCVVPMLMRILVHQVDVENPQAAFHRHFFLIDRFDSSLDREKDRATPNSSFYMVDQIYRSWIEDTSHTYCITNFCEIGEK